MGAYRIGMAFNKCHQISTHPIFDNLFTASLIKMMGSSQWYDIDYTDPKPTNPPAWFAFDPSVSGPDSKKSTELEKKISDASRTLDRRSRAGPKPEVRRKGNKRPATTRRFSGDVFTTPRHKPLTLWVNRQRTENECPVACAVLSADLC